MELLNNYSMKGELKTKEQALDMALKESSVLKVQNQKLSDALKEALRELAFQNEEMGKRDPGSVLELFCVDFRTFLAPWGCFA